MRVIKTILKNLLLFSVLASFMLSTSGFVVTRHICSHHSTEIVLGEVTDACCEMEKIEKKTASCCSTEKAPDKDKSGECCQFEKTYIRLSENFISSEIPDFSKETLLYSTCELNTIIPAADEFNFPAKDLKNFEQERIPKAKKYLVFHQVKVEPPLI